MFRKYGKYAYWLLGCIGLNTRRILVISRPISAIALQANRNLFSNHAQISDLRKSLITRWQRKTPVSQSLYWNKLGFTIMHLWTRKKNSKWKCYHKKLLRKLRSPLTIHCLKIVRTWSWAKRKCPENNLRCKITTWTLLKALYLPVKGINDLNSSLFCFALSHAL